MSGEASSFSPVQMVLIACRIASALVAVSRVREPLVLCAGLAGSGAAAMLTFWLYFAPPSLGPACA